MPAYSRWNQRLFAAALRFFPQPDILTAWGFQTAPEISHPAWCERGLQTCNMTVSMLRGQRIFKEIWACSILMRFRLSRQPAQFHAYSLAPAIKAA
jgi:hypothetical protein